MSTAGVGLNGFIHQPNGVLMSTTNLTLDSFESTVTAEGITVAALLRKFFPGTALSSGHLLLIGSGPTISAT